MSRNPGAQAHYITVLPLHLGWLIESHGAEDPAVPCAIAQYVQRSNNPTPLPNPGQYMVEAHFGQEGTTPIVGLNVWPIYDHAIPDKAIAAHLAFIEGVARRIGKTE